MDEWRDGASVAAALLARTLLASGASNGVSFQGLRTLNGHNSDHGNGDGGSRA